MAGSCATAHRSDALHRGHVGGRVLVMQGSKAWSDGGEKLPWTERTEANTCGHLIQTHEQNDSKRSQLSCGMGLLWVQDLGAEPWHIRPRRPVLSRKRRQIYENHLQYFTAGLCKLEPNFKGRDGILSLTSKPLIVAGFCSVCCTISEQKPQIFLLIKACLLNQLLGFSSCCNHGPAQAELQCSLLTGTACSTLISADQWS